MARIEMELRCRRLLELLAEVFRSPLSGTDWKHVAYKMRILTSVTIGRRRLQIRFSLLTRRLISITWCGEEKVSGSYFVVPGYLNKTWLHP